jgi:membrane-associated phospholipid phosphatase
MAANGSAYELTVDGKVIASLTLPSQTFFQDQVSMVLSYADLRSERTPEILAQIDNQFAFVAAVTGLHPERHRNTVELLVNAIQFTVLVEMQFKHALACWRPHQYSAQVQPMITTPGHGSLPSGHSTQAFVLARLLGALVPASAEFDAMRAQLQFQAARIATNRVVAGVHFPADSVAGRLLGESIAEFILARLSTSSGSPSPIHCRTFDGAGMDGKSYDLDLADPVLSNGPGYQVSGPVTFTSPIAASTPVLDKLFLLGAAERSALGLVFS